MSARRAFCLSAVVTCTSSLSKWGVGALENSYEAHRFDDFVSHSKGLSTVFCSINSSDNSPFSHSVLPVLSLPSWSF